jgi:hypothetical protein
MQQYEKSNNAAQYDDHTMPHLDDEITKNTKENLIYVKITYLY